MQMKKTLLGAHISIAGGIYKSIDRAERIGCTAMQIFSGNNNRWKTKDISQKDVEKYKDKLRESNIEIVGIHNSYLINLASPKEEVELKSITAMKNEIEKMNLLEAQYLIIHPGAYLYKDLEWGVEKIAANLDMIIDETKPIGKILLETTAGQGTAIGRTLEEISEIRKRMKNYDFIGFCLDTCHLFAAGYDFRTKDKYEIFVNKVQKVLGLDNVNFFHLNDSKKDLAARKDRHEHIGKGKIGVEAFQFIMNDKRFENSAKVIETPKGKDGYSSDIENINKLKDLIK